jgi:hypothetical protein
MVAGSDEERAGEEKLDPGFQHYSKKPLVTAEYGGLIKVFTMTN